MDELSRYRRWYSKLLRLYSRPFRERFAESMEQTFDDLCRERAEAETGLLSFVGWIFAETLVAILVENVRFISMKYKSTIYIAVAIAVILAVPLVAMQFTDEVNWDVTDFVIAGILLSGAGLLYELISRKAGSISYRVAVGLAVGTGLFLIWSNLAVGLIGSEENPANLLYGAVIAVGLIGAFIARFRALAMSVVMLATAFVQVLVPVVALIIWRPDDASGLGGVALITAFFVVLWSASAFLFRRAGTLKPAATAEAS